MFSIEMLPAKDGDCLWIEYGTPDGVNRVVIDGGPLGASDALRSRIEALPVADRNLELLVVTHIDSDHIAGIVKLFQSPPEGLFIKQVWFNAYRHLVEGYLGAKEAEFLTVYLQKIEDKRPGFLERCIWRKGGRRARSRATATAEFGGWAQAHRSGT